MSTSDESGLPDIATILGRLLARVPVDRQPLLLAIAERLAAARYRAWADEIGDDARRRDLLACAVREEEIAERVEALYAGAAAIQRQIRDDHPDLDDINRDVFAGRPLGQQLRIQALGERLGASAWRAYAEQDGGSARSEAFSACADLEEASARMLESILDAGLDAG